MHPPRRPCVRSRLFGCLCLCACEGGGQAGGENENPDDDAGGDGDADTDEDDDKAEIECQTEVDDTDADVPVFSVFAWFRFISLCLFFFLRLSSRSMYLHREMQICGALDVVLGADEKC